MASKTRKVVKAARSKPKNIVSKAKAAAKNAVRRVVAKPRAPAGAAAAAKPAAVKTAALENRPAAAVSKTAIEVLGQIRTADKHLKDGRIEDALALGKAIVASHPELAHGHNLLARIHAKAGDSAAALACLEKAAELDPQDNLALERLANAQIKARKWDEARTTIGRIIGLGASDRSLMWLRQKLVLLDRRKDDPFLSLAVDPETVWETGQYLARRPLELLKLPGFRSRLGRQRRNEMVKARGVKLLEETDNIIHNAVVHNFDYIDSSTDDGARPNLLINPLSAIDYINANAANMKVLTIGPRSETEIFCLMAAGFQLDNIQGVDLISFSPLIQSGDMHALPFPDQSFDIVIAGWVLAYSKNNKQAAGEILRVAKPNAYIAVGCAYTPPERGRREEDHAGKNIVGTRFSDVQDILQHFEPHIKQVYFRGEVERDRRKGTAAVTTVFQVKADY
jgi:tetratricopeptide (TPR) repeat protein